jgi:hypothetical protein
VSSIIMQRAEVAETASHRTHRGSASPNERVPYMPPQRSAGTWPEALPSPFELGGMRDPLRHLAVALMNAVMLGGVFVVPIAALVALWCAWMPVSQPLHHTAPTFFAVASFWFMLALLLSHFQHHGSEDPRRGQA